MGDVRVSGFQWREEKNRENIAKHKIDFKDVIVAFQRPMIDVPDTREKHFEEDRTNSLGVIGATNPLYVHITHTERGGDVRLISTRKATPHEVELYHSHLRDLQLSQQQLNCLPTVKRESVADQAMREYNARPESVRSAEREAAARDKKQQEKGQGRERSLGGNDPRYDY